MEIFLNQYPKFYALKGKDTLTLKCIIPKNTTDIGKTQNPIYNKKYGYMYFMNDTNKIKLDKFMRMLEKLGKKINNPDIKSTKEVEKNYELVKHMFRKTTSTYGILGFQVEYNPSDWVEEITGKNWDPKFNPIKEAGGTWKFSKSSVSTDTNNRVAKMLKKTGRWKRYYGSLGYDTKLNELIKIKKWRKFMECDDYISATVDWSHHARFVFKDVTDKVLIFFDPWKKNVNRSKAFKNLSDYLENIFNYTTKFINRSPDQSDEGSCTTQALMRALMLADYGISGATMEVSNDYAVFTARLTSICRV